MFVLPHQIVALSPPALCANTIAIQIAPASQATASVIVLRSSKPKTVW